MVSTELLAILVCPLCKQQVVQAQAVVYLECSECQLRYPVRSDIPVMLVEEAKKMETVN